MDNTTKSFIGLTVMVNDPLYSKYGRRKNTFSTLYYFYFTSALYILRLFLIKRLYPE